MLPLEKREGEALFDVRSMPAYGQLSRRNLDEQQAGARVDVKDHKRNPGDFVLWKESSAEEPGWDATFTISTENQQALRLNSNSIGIRGRPGWHIECLGHEPASSGRGVRHPWRRSRPDLPPPRKTNSPSPAAPTAPRRWPTTGSTMAICRSRGARCRKARGISSRSMTSCTPTSSADGNGRARRSSLPCCEPTIAVRWTGPLIN